MAGHGRTGWLLAKLIQYFEKCSGDEAVKRCRERFCEECVESMSQLDNLNCVTEIESDLPGTSREGVYYDWKDNYYRNKSVGYPPATNYDDVDNLKEKSITPISETEGEIDDELLEIYMKEQRGEELTSEEQRRLDEDIAQVIAWDMKKAEEND